MFFTIAYVIGATLELTSYLLLQHDHLDIFALNIVAFASIIPSEVLPVTYVLWVHNKIYNRMTTQAAVSEKSSDIG